MKRRDLFTGSLTVSAMALGTRRLSAFPAPAAEFPKAPGLTKSVAEFIVNTKYADIPQEVIELGKKSILDGFGPSKTAGYEQAGYGVDAVVFPRVA